VFCSTPGIPATDCEGDMQLTLNYWHRDKTLQLIATHFLLKAYQIFSVCNALPSAKHLAGVTRHYLQIIQSLVLLRNEPQKARGEHCAFI
jgi:hypothetical protein